MPDLLFEHPRLVAIYDALDSDRRDLLEYLRIVTELGARRVLDVGCGTGTFALLLAARGLQVHGVDPASGSLAIARGKPGAQQVHWLDGDARTLPALQVDLVTMTGNVAQAIVGPTEWEATLTGVFAALRPGGHVVFESRDPAAEAWREWNRTASYRQTMVPGVGEVETWFEVTDIRGQLVSFRSHFVFASDGETLTSDSTLRFRGRDDLEAALRRHGFAVIDVREAPDRPGREFVFLARRAA